MKSYQFNNYNMDDDGTQLSSAYKLMKSTKTVSDCCQFNILLSQQFRKKDYGTWHGIWLAYPLY